MQFTPVFQWMLPIPDMSWSMMCPHTSKSLSLHFPGCMKKRWGKSALPCVTAAESLHAQSSTSAHTILFCSHTVPFRAPWKQGWTATHFSTKTSTEILVWQMRSKPFWFRQGKKLRVHAKNKQTNKQTVHLCNGKGLSWLCSIPLQTELVGLCLTETQLWPQKEVFNLEIIFRIEQGYTGTLWD